jgi:2-keto-3-deoxy-L-rhamnonate aldolase RhmA
MNMQMPIKGDLTIMENHENGLLFEIANNEAFINAYAEEKSQYGNLDEIIENQIAMLKNADFSLSSNKNLKENLKNMENTIVSSIKTVNSKFKDAKILIFKKDDFEQLQLFVDLETHFLIFGLVFKGGKVSQSSVNAKKYLKDILQGVNSLTKLS